MQKEIPFSSSDLLKVPGFLSAFGVMIFVLCLISFKVNRRLTWGRWLSVLFYLGAVFVASRFFFRLVGFGPDKDESTVYNAAPFSTTMIVAHYVAFFAPIVLIIIQFGLDFPLRKAAARMKAEDS
jgi:hypothetical protein